MRREVDNFQVYPSGFLGKTIPDQALRLQSTKVAVLPNNMFAVKLHEGKDKDAVGSPAINEIFRQILSHERQLTNFNFREIILKEALATFASTSFTNWLYIQTNSPRFSAMHRDFLEDTVRMVLTGKRKMSIDNWLITMSRAEPTFFQQKLEFSPETRKLIDRGESQCISMSAAIMSDIHETIASWISYRNGFEDFVQTLYLLFGDSKN